VQRWILISVFCSGAKAKREEEAGAWKVMMEKTREE
jgi:hypothetical protein